MVLVVGVLADGVVNGLCRVGRVDGHREGRLRALAGGLAVIDADQVTGCLVDRGVVMRTLSQLGLFAVVPAVEVGGGVHIVGKVGGERTAVCGGGHLRGGRHGVLRGHGRHTSRALTTGGLVVAFHVEGAGGIGVAVEGHRVGVLRAQHGGVVRIVVAIPAALRAVLSNGGGEDNLTGTATGVVSSGDLRVRRNRIHRDIHRDALAFTTGTSVAGDVEGGALGQVGLIGEAGMDRFSASFRSVPVASVAVAALGNAQSEGTLAAA